MRAAFYGLTFALLLPACDMPENKKTGHDACATCCLPVDETGWLDLGVVIRPGNPGVWDARLGGMINPAAVIKKNDTYFLYYIGADGNRSTDGGPRFRSLGVAISQDGLTYTKYEKNPVIVFRPNGNEEEGIFSAAAILDDRNRVHLYYAACDAGSPVSVNVTCDIRLAISEDGYSFNDVGVVLSHNDSRVWGYGDELFPVGVIQSFGRTYLYYIAKGHGDEAGIASYWHKFLVSLGARGNAFWDMGVAWGRDGEGYLSSTSRYIRAGDEGFIIGGGDIHVLGEDYVRQIIVRGFDNVSVEVRRSLRQNVSTPGQICRRYSFGNLSNATAFMDEDGGERTLFLYYLNESQDAIGILQSPSCGF